MAKRATVTGEVNAARDVVLGDQINYQDTAQVEALLGQIVELLRAQTTALRVEPGQTRRDSIIVITGDGNTVVQGDANEVRVSSETVRALARLRPAAAAQREELYLTRFILDAAYARWERLYIPLAGQLHEAALQAGLRLSDRADQGISPAGLMVDDLRAAITAHGKTRLIILGDPGAGKTTTLDRFALDLARERLRAPQSGKLPLRVDLFKFTRPDPQPNDFLRDEWAATGLATSYGEALAAGEICFLLDGVNQMPTADRAQRVERWAHWADRDLPGDNWAIFTCRSADYEQDLRLPEVRVQTLDAGRIRRYFEVRFGAAQGDAHWQELDKRLRSGDHHFERLARNPFMLSLLADRVEQGKSLADHRASLLDDLAWPRLEHELQYGRQPEALTADKRGTLQAAMEALSRLAFAMQAQGEGTSFTEAAMRRVRLTQTGAVKLSLREVLELAEDATVLERAETEGQPATYAFHHHLLQEYFAARELVRQFRAARGLGAWWLARRWRAPWRWWQFSQGLLRRLAPSEPLAPPPVTDWDETVRMAAGLAGKDAPRFIEAVRRANLPLAGHCLAELRERPELQELVNTLRTELHARQQTITRQINRPHLSARLGAGLALGELGHPELLPQPFEFEGRTVWAILPPRQTIPAGEFLRGSDREDKDAYPDEYTAERRVTLPAYALGRYPVTNAEFRYFLEADGYHRQDWWSEAGWQWRQGGPTAHAAAIEDWLDYRKWLQGQDLKELAVRQNWTRGNTNFWRKVTQLDDDAAHRRAEQLFDRPFDRPGFWDDPLRNSPARPVVGVNWHEAEAYCAWLSAVTAQTFRLPTELEWEKAARGEDGRRYPWGDKFEPARCNTVESHIYATTPVGLYPNGVSPYGLFDASGNVWEWTSDWYEMYPGGEPSDDFGEKFRTVRGGSWYFDRRNARCAYRDWNVPDNFVGNVGFRVLSPGSYS